MNLALISHNHKIEFQKELTKNQQHQKMISLQNIEQFSKEILQRYTNNIRMEVKQQLIEIKCPQISIGTSQKSNQLRKRQIKQWLSQVCNSVFSIAYNSYKKSQISEQQMKIFCSENLLLNIIKLSESNDLAKQDYEFIDKVLKNDILSYYKDKYPPTMQKQSYKKFKTQVQDIDTMEDFEKELIKISNLQELIEKRIKEYYNNQTVDVQFYDLMMQFINFCLQLPDKKFQQGKENSYFDEFRTQMTEIFRNVEDINYMRSRKTQDKSQKSQKELDQEQEYREKVKKYTHFKIGRKIPQHIPKFTQQQIINGNIKIKDPTILRFLTKWLQQLEENLENIYTKLQLVGHDLDEYYSWGIQDIKRRRKQLLQYYQNKIYEQQQFCSYSYLDNKQIDTIPKNDKLVGAFSHIASQYQQSFIVNLIDRTIYCLLRLTWRSKFIIPSITCKIGDLIRCKCSSGQKQILKIYQQLKDRSNKNPQNFKIIRTKNRLEKGTKDILINVLFKNTILCQIQLSINQDQSSQSILNSFNHYLYQLQRSQFGPINEMASVWTKDQRYQQIVKLLEKNRKHKIQNQCECKVQLQQQYLPESFICNYCDRYYDKIISFVSHKKCQKCALIWKCSNCLLDQIVDDQTQKKKLLEKYSKKDGCQLINLGNQDVKIPKYGMFISKNSKTKNFIEFKSFDLPSQKNIYLVAAEGNKYKIIQTISKDKHKQFFNDKIVFSIQKINELQTIDDSEFKKTNLLPKSIKVLYKNKSEALKLASNNLSSEQFDSLTKGQLNNYKNIKSLTLARNKIQKMGTLLTRFENLQTLNLSCNSIRQIPEQIGNMKQLKILNLNQNSIETISSQFERLNNLTELDISSNGIQTIPRSLGNLNKLIELNISRNQIQTLPQSIGNLNKLRTLQITQNNIQVIPKCLGNLINLKSLNISMNKIETIPQFLGNLINLTQLSFIQNSIQTIPQCLGNLKSLKSLDMSINKIETIPQFLGNLINLTQLSFLQNSIQTIPQCLGNLKSLKSLDMSMNKIETVPQCLGNLSKLIDLSLSQNQIQTLPQSFGNLKSLRILRISNNKIQAISQCFGNLDSLAFLEIYCNKIQAFHQCFGNLQNLTQLYIESNQLQTFPQCFRNLKRLSFLILKNNKITVTRQLLQSLMTMKTNINLQNNQISLSEQDHKWMRQNQLDKRITLQKRD